MCAFVQVCHLTARNSWDSSTVNIQASRQKDSSIFGYIDRHSIIDVGRKSDTSVYGYIGEVNIWMDRRTDA